MYECNILKCSHNSNGKCKAQFEIPCTDYPNAEYFATDQLFNANKCNKLCRENKCKECEHYFFCQFNGSELAVAEQVQLDMAMEEFDNG